MVDKKPEKTRTMKNNHNKTKRKVKRHWQRHGTQHKRPTGILYDIDKELLKVQNMKMSLYGVKPQDDFYSYINNRWIRDYKLGDKQQYITQIDDFFIIQDKVYRELLDITRSYIKKNNTKKSQCIEHFYKSMISMNTNKQSRKHANDTLDKIDELRSENEGLWKLLAFVNKNEMISWGSPIVWSVASDDKDPTINRCYVDLPILTLIDYDLYDNSDKDDKDDIENRLKYKNHYLKYLKELFANSFGQKHSFHIEDVFNVEKKILHAMDYNKKADDDIDGYNKINANDAKAKYDFDWNAFSKSLGFNSIPSFFIATSINYLKSISMLLMNEWASEEWRTYWIYLFIRQQQRFNTDGHIINFNFNGKYVSGQDHEVGKELFPIYGIGYAFNTFLTEEYDKVNNSSQMQENYEYTKKIYTALIEVFKNIITRNTWLHETTKKHALQKLDAITFNIGIPSKLQDDPLLAYSDNDVWSNFMKITEWKHKNRLANEGKLVLDVPETDWSLTPPKLTGTQAYIVNASYCETTNSITIPMAYVQKPFINLENQGIEYNLAYMGFTLAHEMSHALDDLGSKYDKTGKLNEWWKPKDRRIFNNLQKDIIKQYEAFASFDDIDFDAEPSIGEDIADIVGLSICIEYLQNYHYKNESPLSIHKISFEKFFTYYAVQERQKIKKRALDIQLKTNPHPLDKYRTNVPLSRIPLFRKIYDIQKGDKMYWHSTHRIWEK